VGHGSNYLPDRPLTIEMRTHFGLALKVLVAATAIPTVTPEAHEVGEPFSSPNGVWLCEIRRQSTQGGNELAVRNKKARENEIIVWRSPRWLDAAWSPDSKFLAVTDHYDGHESAVFIFAVPNIQHADFRLIFQTPRNDDIQAEWSLRNWSVERREVVLNRRVERPEEQPIPKGKSRYEYATFTFPLGTAAIKQNFYSDQ
jgi:hypothetical protein